MHGRGQPNETEFLSLETHSKGRCTTDQRFPTMVDYLSHNFFLLIILQNVYNMDVNLQAPFKLG